MNYGADALSQEELDKRKVEGRILHSAYSFVRSREMNKAVASLTLDHLIQEHIESIQGGDTRAMVDSKGQRNNLRPTKLQELDKLENDITDFVAKATS
jgi:hypothetical protein